MHIAKWKKKKQSENATCCIIPMIRHSGKGKTIEAGKKWVVASGWVVKEWIEKKKGFLGQWNYPVWNFNDDTWY